MAVHLPQPPGRATAGPVARRTDRQGGVGRVPGAGRQRVRAGLQEGCADRATGSATAYYPDHDRWYETHVYPAARGGITIYFRNATEQIRAQQEIGRLAEGRRLALDAAGLGSWHVNLATGELTTDERFRSIFGIAGERTELETAIGLIHPDDRQRVRAALAAATDPADPRPYSDEHRLIRPDSSIRWIHAVGLASFAGEGAERRLASFDGTIADVTERRATEEAVREGEKRLREAYDLLEGITEGTQELIARSTRSTATHSSTRPTGGISMRVRHRGPRRRQHDRGARPPAGRPEERGRALGPGRRRRERLDDDGVRRPGRSGGCSTSASARSGTPAGGSSAPGKSPGM